MSIIMTGIDHHSAGIDLRSSFSFTKKKMKDTLEKWKAEAELYGIVILSTCNRTEIYASAADPMSASDLFRKICLEFHAEEAAFLPYFFQMEGMEAVQHLFRLAGGLESRILGENQILTQIREAVTISREQCAADSVMETLFRQALTVGKRIRTSAGISAADQSVVHAAFEQLEEEGFSFQGKQCLVIGNGIMGKLAASLLQERGADVTVTIRQYRRGMVEVTPGCERIDYGKRMTRFSESDVVVSATMSPNFTLTKELVAGVETAEDTISSEKNIGRLSGDTEKIRSGTDRIGRDRILIDLAVPRDIEPSVAELPGICLFDIDDFRRNSCSKEQQKGISRAEEYIREEMEKFSSWYEMRDLAPHIHQLNEKMTEDMVQRITDRCRSFFYQNDRPQFQEEVRIAVGQEMKKMLYGLRDGMDPEQFRTGIDCLENLYLQKQSSEDSKK